MTDTVNEEERVELVAKVIKRIIDRHYPYGRLSPEIRAEIALAAVTALQGVSTTAMLDAGEQAYDNEPEGYGAHRRGLAKAYTAMRAAAPTAPVQDDERDALQKALAETHNERAVLVEALTEIVDYRGGADTALSDEYVMDRVHAALAAARGDQSPDVSREIEE